MFERAFWMVVGSIIIMLSFFLATASIESLQRSFWIAAFNIR